MADIDVIMQPLYDSLILQGYDLSSEKFTECHGMSKVTIWRWFKKKKWPKSLHILCKVLDYLGYELRYVKEMPHDLFDYYLTGCYTDWTPDLIEGIRKELRRKGISCTNKDFLSYIGASQGLLYKYFNGAYPYSFDVVLHHLPKALGLEVVVVKKEVD